MNQVYLSAKQNGGLIFAARYPDISTWINNAPEAAAYITTIQAATNAYNQAVKMKMELERASMPSDLQRAIDMMQTPSGDPATNNAPAGWTKVPDGAGILRWQPDFHIDTNGADWRASLSNGSAGAFSIAMKSSQSSSDFKSSFAKGSTSVGNFFWSVNASGGWSKSDLFNQDSSSAVKISCESSTRVKVNPGDWYPGGFMSELAKAQQGPNGQGYTIVAPWVANGGPGSSSLFGPNGIVAARVSELLVVYKPSFEITMSAKHLPAEQAGLRGQRGCAHRTLHLRWHGRSPVRVHQEHRTGQYLQGKQHLGEPANHRRDRRLPGHPLT